MATITPQPSARNNGVSNWAPKRTKIALCLLAPLSLVQFYLVARLINPIFIGTPLSWVASIRLPAFLVSMAVVGYFGWASLRWPVGLKRYAWIGAVAMASLVVAYVLIYAVRVWVPTLPTAGGMVIFLGTGLLAEEFWFRGAIYSLAEQIWPNRRFGWAVGLSALCYGLSHWQYHGFAFTAAAAVQIGYTFLLGLVLGLLRGQTRSVWTAVGLHLAVNLIATLAIQSA